MGLHGGEFAYECRLFTFLQTKYYRAGGQDHFAGTVIYEEGRWCGQENCGRFVPAQVASAGVK